MSQRIWSLQSDGMEFDAMASGLAAAQANAIRFNEVLEFSPEEHLENFLDNIEFALGADDCTDPLCIYSDDPDEAKARFEAEFITGLKSYIREQLEDKLYQMTTGDVYNSLIVAPGGTKDGIDYGPRLIEIVVLDPDGNTIAFRYSDDSINEEWEIGDIEDAVEAWANAPRE